MTNTIPRRRFGAASGFSRHSRINRPSNHARYVLPLGHIRPAKAPRFSVPYSSTSEGVLNVLTAKQFYAMLDLHAHGDWGTVSDRTRLKNERVLRDGHGLVFSTYVLEPRFFRRLRRAYQVSIVSAFASDTARSVETLVHGNHL